MPSHIFVRLGQWQRTINWNIRSAAAAKKHYLKGGVMPMHYVHALDYLMYAYLQQAEDKKAAKVLEQLNSVEKYQPTFPASYGIAAARARFYLEQHLWKQSAQIPLEMPKDFPWQKFPMAQSITYFAWGMGAIREGNLSQGKEAIEQLDKFYKQLENSKQNYWATLVDSKKQSLLAWLQLEEGDKKTALKLMKRAAVLEDSVDKHPVTPGEVLPARELYGDMLMKVGQPKMALKAYQAVLKISPNRFNSLYGAASAAAQTGNQGLAKDYYGQLIKLTQKADTDRAEIKIAKTYLKMN